MAEITDRTIRVGYAAEGEQLKIRVGPRDDDQLATFTVEPSCQTDELEPPNSGHWLCLTHPDTDLSNNMKVGSHTETGDHKMVWICHAHGPETVKYKKEDGDEPT